MNSSSFWQDQAQANLITKELKELKNSLEEYQKIEGQMEELDILYELNIQENNEETWQELAVKTVALEDEADIYERNQLFSGEYDKSNAIVSIHSGAGGVESQDWVEMLLRMYLR